jgi:hypothetical protein
VEANPDIKSAHLETFLSKKFHNYLYTYNRIANEYKLDFLKRFSEEFRESYEKEEFTKRMLDSGYMSILERIMEDPEQFYYDDTVRALSHEYIRLSDMISAIEETESNNGK